MQDDASCKSRDTARMMVHPAKVKEEAEMRRVAFLGVALSTIATVVVVVSVPLLYQYLQTVQSALDAEAAFCRSRSEDLWEQVMRGSTPNYS